MVHQLQHLGKQIELFVPRCSAFPICGETCSLTLPEILQLLGDVAQTCCHAGAPAALSDKIPALPTSRRIRLAFSGVAVADLSLALHAVRAIPRLPPKLRRSRPGLVGWGRTLAAWGRSGTGRRRLWADPGRREIRRSTWEPCSGHTALHVIKSTAAQAETPFKPYSTSIN